MKFDKEALKNLPKSPGVYLYKNATGEIIYVGKAAVLRNRVRQYFQNSRTRDAKTDALVAEIVDVNWIEVESELDALFLEAELIRRYMPRYNILLRDDKSTAYVRISYKSDHPTVTVTRQPLDDGAEYFGPYFNATTIRRALQLLRRVFPYSTHNATIPHRVCLQYHLGLCPGLEDNRTSLQDYRANLRKLMQYLKGERKALIREIEQAMNTAAKKFDFEQAASYRNQLFALKNLSKQIVFSDKEFLDISKDQGLAELAELLELYDKKPEKSSTNGVQQSNDQQTKRALDIKSDQPRHSTRQFNVNFAEKQSKALRKLRRIEGYDISHMSGTDTVASMVVFVNGLPHKTAYRKFKMRVPGNNDFAHMREVIMRRLSEKNIKDWGLPDLFLIDGGKGQVSSALAAMREKGFNIPIIGLAKREEEIIIPKADGFKVVLLPKSNHAVKLLQRIRDESHRFAISYHSVLKQSRQKSSWLDDIPGIGPKTRKKLLRSFGSLKAVTQASSVELASVIGPKKATVLQQFIHANHN